MGLSPAYYDSCTDDVLNLYAELEDRIIADVVRRIVKTGDITETAKWQIRQAQQMGLLYDDIIKDVAQYTSKTDSEIKKMFENAGVETVSNDNRIHLLAGNSPLDIRQSESMLQILNAVYKERLTDLKNLTGTTAITSQTAYYNACNSAFMMVSSGAFSYQQALRTVIQEVGKNGVTVSYPSGHNDKLDVAVRRSLLTGIGLASRQISEENSRLCGCDLMEISAHSGARPSHAAWQGQIVSLSGRKGYLSKSDIGYGTGAGFGGWNCRHDWYPFYEGISSRNYSKKDLEKLNAKDIEYKGKMYSEYEISQMLRKKEREIRSLKREKTAYNTAIMETSDKQLKAVFQSALTYTNSAIRDKSAEIKQFCADTDYKCDRFREQVGGKTSVGHGFGEFSKQNQKFNLKSSLTSVSSSDEKTNRFLNNAKNKLTGNNYLNVIDKFSNSIAGIENNTIRLLFKKAMDNVEFEKSKREHSYFAGEENKIYLLNNIPVSTIAHELFHKIDKDNGITIGRVLDDSIEKDYKNLIESAEKAGLSIEDMLYSKYPEAFEKKGRLKEKYRGVSDIINGMTNGEINLGYYHKTEYWKKPYKLQKETFAQYGRFLYDNNSEVMKTVNELFPATTYSVNNILKAIELFGE